VIVESESEFGEFGTDIGGALLLTLLAIIAIVLARADRLDPREWATTSAIVLSTDSRFVAQGDNGQGFLPLVRYRYDVGRIEYESDTYAHPREQLFEKDEIGAAIDRYAAGQTITVHYKRSDPGRSMIVVRTMASAMVWDIAVTLTLVGSIIAWIVVVRGRRAKRKARRSVARGR
jgi:hypothetical protein